MSARVVLDSVSPADVRLTTVEATYWRAIHSELMTHRDRARNAASSRAIPFYRERLVDGKPVSVDNCTYTRMLLSPFIPKYIGEEQKGMQSGGELEGPARVEAESIIMRMKGAALEACYRLYELGVHKSIINRYLEPWSMITVIMTATEWKNFFRLRIHPKAEKHFCDLAREIRDAIDESTPQRLGLDEWHMPYIQEGDREEVRALLVKKEIPIPQSLHERDSLEHITTEVLKRISAARCARVSYLNHDGQKSYKDDLRIFDTLINPVDENGEPDTTIHSSPLEHVARATSGHMRSGPFRGWRQFRKDFSNENVAG